LGMRVAYPLGGVRSRRVSFIARFGQAKILGVTLLFLLLIASAMPLVLAESETYVLVNQWGDVGHNNGEFWAPHGIAVDSSGNVYVVDTFNGRIQVFDSNGEFIKKWGAVGSGNGNFSGPNGIAVDSSGNVYVADTSNYRVQKFDSDGAFIASWGGPGAGAGGGFALPCGVAVDGSGNNVYIADTSNHRICKYDSNGNLIKIWGGYGAVSEGDVNGLFYYPHNIGVDASGNVYVADTSNERIQKFDSNGVFITKWGSAGSNNSQFAEPCGIDFDSSGNVYVADSYNSRIQKFSSDGVFITSFAIGSLNYCYDVAVDSSGNVYVPNSDANRIQKYALSSPTVTPTPTPPPFANYSIVASAGPGGTINPSETQFAHLGSNYTYAITPDAGYKISDVVVDGVSKGAISTYYFENIQTSHQIAASFSPIATDTSPFPTGYVIAAVAAIIIAIVLAAVWLMKTHHIRPPPPPPPT
jgi:DNA-binding beta-propeller fold protein YncE